MSVFSRQGVFLRAFGKDVVPGNGETGFEECAQRCKAGARGAGPGEMNLPVLPSFDCRGAVYVPEVDNGRVQRFGEPGTDSPPCGRPAARSRQFGITLTVAVPWPAELRLHGRGIKRATRQVEFAGRVRLAVRPKAATGRRLGRRGSALVRARVTYAPWGGEPRTKTKRIELQQRAPTRR